MKYLRINLRTVLKSASLSILSFLLVVGVLYAATTIGSNIDMAGTLLVNNATSTVTNLVMVNATSTNATTTTLAITGNSNLATASSTGLVKAKSLKFSAAVDSTLSGMAFGYCNIPAKTIVGTTIIYAVCDTATGVLASDRVFVQATSSLNGGGATLAGGAFVVAASSTAADTISVLLGSTGDADGTTVTTPVSINFWAIR